MLIKCQRCGTEYDLDDSLIGAQKTRVRCTSCGRLFEVRVQVAVESMIPKAAKSLFNSTIRPWAQGKKSQEAASSSFDDQLDAALGSLDNKGGPRTKKVYPIQIEPQPSEMPEKPRSTPRVTVTTMLAAVGGAAIVGVAGLLLWKMVRTEPQQNESHPAAASASTAQSSEGEDSPENSPNASDTASGTTPAPQTNLSLAQADLLARQDQLSTYADAVEVYRMALTQQAGKSSGPELSLKLSRTYARWAQTLRFHLLDRGLPIQSIKEAHSLAPDHRPNSTHTTSLPSTPLSLSQAKHLVQEADELAHQAEQYARRALTEVKSGFSPKVEFAIADAARLVGRTEEAKARLRRAQALTDQLDADDWYIATLIDARDLTSDLCAYETQLRASSDAPGSSVGILLLLARCYQQSGRKGMARAEIEGVRARYPGHSEAAALLRTWGESAEPGIDEIPNTNAASFKDAFASMPMVDLDLPSETVADPGDTVLAAYAQHVKKGFAGLYHRKTFNEAKEHFKKAIGVWAQGGSAYAGLGYAARAENQIPEAVENFRKAGRLNYNVAWYELGNTFVSMTRYPEARKCFDRYMKAEPQGRWVPSAKRTMKLIARLRPGDPPPELPSHKKKKTDEKTDKSKTPTQPEAKDKNAKAAASTPVKDGKDVAKEGAKGGAAATKDEKKEEPTKETKPNGSSSERKPPDPDKSAPAKP